MKRTYVICNAGLFLVKASKVGGFIKATWTDKQEDAKTYKTLASVKKKAQLVSGFIYYTEDGSTRLNKYYWS
jgi:hypothetical protein